MSAMSDAIKRGDRERCRCQVCSPCPRWTETPGKPCSDCARGDHAAKSNRKA